MASFESSTDSEDQYQKYPIRRLEPSIQKFLKVIKIDLGRLHQHKLNIEKFNRLHDWTSLNGENINATRTVQQIKANLQEIEKVRHQVLEEDLDAFDNKINDMRESAIQSVLEFTSLSGTQTEAAGSSTTGRNSTGSTPEYETSPPSPGHRVQGRRTVSESTAQFSIQDLPENSNVEESWENLQESLEDLNTMIHEFATVVNSQQEKVDKIEDNIDQAEADVQQGTINLGKASKYKAAIFPVAGAVIGTALGGPVGLAVGIKLGALAGAVGGTAGLVGGSILKKKTQQVSEVEMKNLTAGRTDNLDIAKND